MSEVVYLDNNSTTRPATEVVEAMLDCLTNGWGNPSSVHRAGQNARQRIELAREAVSRLIGCESREVIFNSGGTEGANHVLRGLLHQHSDRQVLLTDRVEHSATRETAERLSKEGVEVLWLTLDEAGLVDVEQLAAILTDRSSEIGLVSVQWVNNETGAVQPIEAIGRCCHEFGVLFHCDGTQWVGKMPTAVKELPIDMMTFSAHKYHGPKGVGALYIRRGVRLPSVILGGPQERERRGGTENTPGIVGMGVASELAAEWVRSNGPESQGALRDRFERTILDRVAGTSVNQGSALRIWNTTNLAFPNLEAEAILLLLSERGIYASAGAACSSGSLDPSPVLLSMGVPAERAHGSVRFSLSRMTTANEIDRACDVVPAVIERLNKSMTQV